MSSLRSEKPRTLDLRRCIARIAAAQAQMEKVGAELKVAMAGVTADDQHHWYTLLANCDDQSHSIRGQMHSLGRTISSVHESASIIERGE